MSLIIYLSVEQKEEYLLRLVALSKLMSLIIYLSVEQKKEYLSLFILYKV